MDPQHRSPGLIPQPSRDSHMRFSPLFLRVARVSFVLLLLLGGLSWIGDQVTRSPITTTWLQVSGCVLGVLALFAAGDVTPRSRINQFLWIAAGGLFLSAVLDSSDGHQDLMTGAMAGTLLFSISSLRSCLILWIDRPAASQHRRVAGLGAVVAVALVGSAIYQAWYQWHFAVPWIPPFVLFTASLVLDRIVTWSGGLTPAAAPLIGRVRPCDTCGFRNIPERNLCKQCGSILGPIEFVSK